MDNANSRHPPASAHPRIAKMDITPFTCVAVALFAAFTLTAHSTIEPIKPDRTLIEYPVGPYIEFLVPEPVYVLLDADGSIYLGEAHDLEAIRIDWLTLGSEVRARVEEYSSRAVTLVAHPEVRFRDVMRARAVLEHTGAWIIFMVSMDICGTGEGEVAC